MIIAPGDSPAKYINVFRLCGFDVSKFVQFPISGLGETEGISSDLQGKLDDYIALVLEDVDITSTTKVCIFDYVSSGASVKYITKSLNTLFSVKLSIVKIQEDQRATNEKQYGIFKSLMIEGEIHGSRAVRYYPVSSFDGVLPPLEEPHLWKSNLICMMVALHYLRRLKEIGDNNPQTLVEEYKLYNCSYYDFESGEIKQCILYLKDGDVGSTFVSGTTKFIIESKHPEIKMFSVLQITSEIIASVEYWHQTQGSSDDTEHTSEDTSEDR